MNKTLLFSSIFLFNLCSAQDEILTTSEQEVTISKTNEQAETISSQETIATADEQTATISNEEPAATYDLNETEDLCDQDIIINEYIEDNDSLVYEFVLNINSINDEWLSILNDAKKLIPNESEISNSKAKDCIKQTLQFTQAAQNKALNDKSNQNISCATYAYLSSCDSSEIHTQYESYVPNYIAIKYIITKKDGNDDANLWPLLNNILQIAKTETENKLEAEQNIASLNEFLPKFYTLIDQIIDIINTDNNNELVLQNLYIYVKTENDYETNDTDVNDVSIIETTEKDTNNTAE